MLEVMVQVVVMLAVMALGVVIVDGWCQGW